MSILDSDIVDIVATRPESNIVKLVIADHLEWDDFQMHISLLQAKLNTYLEFIESGQLERSLRKQRNVLDIRIRLALQHSPNEQGNEFLERVRIFLLNSAITLEVALPERAN